VPGWPATMRREHIRYEPGAAVSPWLRYQDLKPITVPPPTSAAGCASRWSRPWPPKSSRASLPTAWSLHQVAAALDLRLSRMERACKRQDRAS
jgi:hypothetical protein